MANNVTLPGAGEPVATDQVGANHYQLVKLADGTEDSAVPVAASTANPLSNSGGLHVRQVPQITWNASFSGVSGSSFIAPEMTQRALGTGVGVSQSGGNLVLTAGTTANSEFLARSTQKFTGAMILRHKTILSQRIAQNNFAVLLADRVVEGAACTINSTTSISVTKTAHGLTSANVGQFMFVGAISGAAGVPGRYAIASIPDANTINFTVAGWPASGSCTVDVFGWNFYRTLYNSTTATQAAVDAQRFGWASGDTTATINTSASPGHVMQTHVDGRNVYWSDTLVASGTAPTVTVRASRVEMIPQDDVDLYVYLWLYNGTSSPASGTTWTVGFLSLEDFANMPVYVAGFRQQGFASPLPVVFPAAQAVSQSGTWNVTVNAAIAAGTNAIGDVGLQYRANATGAASKFHLVSAATTNATNVKSSAGRLVAWRVANTNAAWRYVKLHNNAGTPTAGAGVVETIAVPPNGVNNGALSGGSGFATGIAITTVTGSADADATAVAAGDLIIDLYFA